MPDSSASGQLCGQARRQCHKGWWGKAQLLRAPGWSLAVQIRQAEALQAPAP